MATEMDKDTLPVSSNGRQTLENREQRLHDPRRDDTTAAEEIMPRTLSTRASFWVAAAVTALALWTSAAPAVSYPLLASEWHLTAAVTTAIFAIYPITLVAALFIVGNLSDYIGRRAAILFGFAAFLVGTAFFAAAPDVWWLFIGRVTMGVGVALVVSPATSAMVEFSPAGGAKRASAVATAATAAGLALAVLIGGALITYAPFPTRLNFWVLFVVMVVVGGFVWFLPRNTIQRASGKWRPRGISIPRGLRRVFFASAVSVSAGYVIGGIVQALATQIAKDLINSDNALVNGGVIAVFAVFLAASALSARGISAATVVLWGTTAAIIAFPLLLLSASLHSLALFLAASAFLGIAYGLLFLGGLSIINANAPAHHRAGTVGAVYLVAYFFQGAVTFLLGLVVTAHGLTESIQLGAIVSIAMSIVATVLAMLVRRRGAALGPAGVRGSSETRPRSES